MQYDFAFGPREEGVSVSVTCAVISLMIVTKMLDNSSTGFT